MRRSISYVLMIGLTALAQFSVATENLTIQSNKVSISEQPSRLSVEDLLSLVKKKSERNSSSMITCAEIAELRGAFLCVPFYQKQMNDIFLRAGIFWGTLKSWPPGTLIKDTDPVLKDLLQIADGHNLPGSVILSFYDRLRAEMDHNLYAESSETHFWKVFLSHPLVRSFNENFYVIAVSAQQTSNYREILSHEVHHAQYFLDKMYSTVVNSFWTTQVSVDDRKAIASILGAIYSSESEATMIDEFQAYLLELDGDEGILGIFSRKCAEGLRRSLRESNIKILDLK